jgi:glycosyltransferase involved in cell wall biosynthesis
MKVTISVGGKFHAFELAKQLNKRGFLDRIITSYPRFRVLKEGLPKEKVISLPIKEIVQKGLSYIPLLKSRIDLGWYLASLFDIQASKYIRPCDIFVGWSGFSLYTLRKTKAYGAITVVERGSSHIEHQRDIIKEEYAYLRMRAALPDPRIVEKELQEYIEADFISVPSGYAKKTFLEKGVPEDKLIHIPYGVDISLFKPIPKKDNIFRIVYVGQMSIRKGIHYLLEAVSKLDFKNFELWLIGSICDEIRPFFKKYKGYFKYLGHLDYQKLYEYYSQGSVFAFPSLDEGFALVILQAMACGLPVICTTNTAGEDIVRDGIDGFIIPIRNTEAIKEKITYLYENPVICKTMGESGRERVSKGFTWDNYGDRMINTYLNLLNRP